MKTKYFILILLIGLMFSFCLGGYAGFLYQAKDIEFTPDNSEWKVNSVGDAINNIYTDINTPMFDKMDLSIKNTYSKGTRLFGRTISLELEQGNYFIYIVDTSGTSNTSVRSIYSLINSGSLIFNNDICKFITGSNSTQDNNNASAGAGVILNIYYCSVKNNLEIVKYKAYGTTTTEYMQLIQMFSVKIE